MLIKDASYWFVLGLIPVVALAAVAWYGGTPLAPHEIAGGVVAAAVVALLGALFPSPSERATRREIDRTRRQIDWMNSADAERAADARRVFRDNAGRYG